MSYIGQQLPADVFSGYTTDSFTGDGSATTFTLSRVPFSEDTLIVVINNVIQKPTTNFTVSGTTLTIVGTAVASGDVIYAIHTGGVIPITQASAVTAGATIDLNGGSDKLILDADADTTISADTDDQIDFKIAGADDFQMTANTFTVASGSKVTYGDGGSQSNLMADEWRINSDLAGGSGTIFTANWERNDTNFSLVGSGMTESSGAFTFPSTGIYYIIARSRVSIAANLGNVKIGISMTTDNSSYSSIALGSAFSDGDDNNSTMFCSAIVDITDTSTHKIKMAYAGADSNVTFLSSTTQMYTGLTFLRLGDT
jgi:hypothetical protein